MTEISRRSFLGGALTLVAATQLPRLPSTANIPTIVGDGVHDDSPGFKAAIEGKPFRLEGEAYVLRHGGQLFIGAGTYRLTGLWALHAEQDLFGVHIEGNGRGRAVA